jgi:UDP:flavonoid glycosyltransferase YjiC (YdhE family)
MKILFFPNDSGGGLGHIKMCLAIAGEAKNRGHLSAFVLSEQKFASQIKKRFPVFVPSFYPRKLKRMADFASMNWKRKQPLYTEISKIDYLVLRDGLVSEHIIGKRVKRYLQAIKKFKPHVLVADTDLTARIVSRITNIPVVQIVRYLSHPDTARLIWWKEPEKEMIPPQSAGLFNGYFRKMGLPELKEAEKLLEGDLYIVPSIPEIEPIAVSEKTHFTGALLSKESDGESQPFCKELDRLSPFVYMTIGGGAGPVGNRELFEAAIKGFSKLPLNLVVSTGKKFGSRSFRGLPDNVHFFEWLPGNLAISKAKMVIAHGGYVTMMESLFHARPSLIIPFHSEQEGNGRRLQQLGCAKVLKLSRQEFRTVEGRWRYGEYSYLVQDRFDLTCEELAESVKGIMNNQEYFVNALKLQAKIKAYGGAAQAVKLIEENVS